MVQGTSRGSITLAGVALAALFVSLQVLFPPRKNSNGKAPASLQEVASPFPSRSSTSSSSSSLQQPPPPPPIIRPGELPGYTGWARPEDTEAGGWRAAKGGGTLPTKCLVGSPCTFSVVGSGGSGRQRPRFYARAYGPAVLTARIERKDPSADRQYDVTFYPQAPGPYTVEVVLTAPSNAPPAAAFPLAPRRSPVLYEGYLLPDFPVSVQVVEQKKRGGTDPENDFNNYEKKPYCEVADLIDAPPEEMLRRASWNVVRHNVWQSHNSINNNHQHNNNNSSLTYWRGYQAGTNSVGFQLDYQYTSCRLVSEQDLQQTAAPFLTNLSSAAATTSFLSENPFGCASPNFPKLHIVLVGDSVMRLQRDYLEALFGLPPSKNRADPRHRHPPFRDPTVRITHVELFGGTLRCQRQTGPWNEIYELDGLRSNEHRVVIFNTGMHDIHRLCGGNKEFVEERREYLTAAELRSPCVDVYRTAVRELALAVQKIPDVSAVIWQSTTAAWPAWGNYGVAWDPRHPQEWPLDAAFCEAFNRVAATALAETAWKTPFRRTDAYWVSLPRPDNREVDKRSAIGKKLSHPGVEVISAMVRTWLQLALILTPCGT